MENLLSQLFTICVACLIAISSCLIVCYIAWRKPKANYKKCNDDCYPICDFCRCYNFNGDEDGIYTEEGYCIFHEEPRDPADFCDNFICINYKRKIY